MTTQQTISDQNPHPGAGKAFDMSVDALLEQLALDNYSLIPCQE
jgi:hypothetical protein